MESARRSLPERSDVDEYVCFPGIIRYSGECLTRSDTEFVDPAGILRSDFETVYFKVIETAQSAIALGKDDFVELRGGFRFPR